MSQFFTTLEKKESKFVGIVLDANTNQVLFRSSEQDLQENALNEVNQFIATFKTTSSTSETTTNTPSTPITHLPPPRRCCGR
jgi:predicted AlkP superfamily pyrophosphatase or phosphodiesterase